MVSAIVLAGGRASRFGSDKLAAELDGEALLAATIRIVSTVANRVIVAGPSLPIGFRAGNVPVTLVPDAEPFAGPLVTVANALATATPDSDDLAIVVGGDMPRVVPAVLQAMLDRLATDRKVTAVILEREAESGPTGGRRQVLPCAVRVEVARQAARDAVDAGQRSLQALLDRVAVVEMSVSAWRSLDPSRQTVLDVDTTADLERIRHRELH